MKIGNLPIDRVFSHWVYFVQKLSHSNLKRFKVIYFFSIEIRKFFFQTIQFFFYFLLAIVGSFLTVCKLSRLFLFIRVHEH